MNVDTELSLAGYMELDDMQVVPVYLKDPNDKDKIHKLNIMSLAEINRLRRERINQNDSAAQSPKK